MANIYLGDDIMDWSTIEFCSDTNYVSKTWAAGLIAEGIFGAVGDADVRKLLLCRYEQMRANFANVSCMLADGSVNPAWNLTDYDGCVCISNSAKPDARLKVPQIWFDGCARLDVAHFGLENLGHDLPSWMCKRGVRPIKKIMVVSIDPKRTGDAAGALYLGTPFGFHCKDYRLHTENDRVFKLVRRLLDLDCFVYLTDAIKLYATQNRKKVDFRDRRNAFGAVLDAEIEIVKPDLILTFGNDALDKRFVVSRLNKAHFPRCGMCAQRDVSKDTVVIAAYHPNPQRRRHDYCGHTDLNSYYDALEARVESVL